MQVQVTGKQLDVGDALRSRISDELTTSIGKFFDRGGDAEVVVSQDGHDWRIDCRVVLASGQFLESHGFAGDAHSAFDEALAKIETRVRRYKRRLKNHHHPGGQGNDAEKVAYTVLRAPSEDEEDDDGWTLPEDGEGPPAAMVIAETEKPVKTQTVAMAVLDLDLSGSQVIVFRNAAHGGISVVYRRADGNIGWIDPERSGRSNGSSN